MPNLSPTLSSIFSEACCCCYIPKTETHDIFGSWLKEAKKNIYKKDFSKHCDILQLFTKRPLSRWPENRVKGRRHSGSVNTPSRASHIRLLNYIRIYELCRIPRCITLAAIKKMNISEFTDIVSFLWLPCNRNSVDRKNYFLFLRRPFYLLKQRWKET